MRMVILALTLVVASTPLLAAPARTAPGEAAGPRPAALIDEGKVNFSFRYRYEHVDDDRFDETADASTLRSRASFKSGTYRDWSFFGEVDDVREVFVDDFNAGAGNTPARSRYPVVADPEGTEINQAFLEFRGLRSTAIRLGRQRINLDAQRFVGGVGWRQNEQTYDAVSVDWVDADRRLFYAVIDNVNRVFGEDVPAGDHRQAPSHLFNASLRAGGLGQLSGYLYALDNEDEPAFSTDTFGLRLAGSRSDSAWSPSYLVEYARQTDAGDNPVPFHANYWHLGGGVKLGGVDVSAGWEVLSGDADQPGKAFRTPLATLHAFNGRADQFLTTPNAGLEDRYLKLKAAPGAWMLELAAHRFDAQDGGADYGREIDLRAGRRLGQHLSVDVIVAAFDGDEGYRDLNKLWLVVAAEF
jgi:hypothetical protein